MGKPTKSAAVGFTLIELMVSIAVLAILVAIATPSFNDFFDKYRVRGAANDVVSVISAARAEAVKSGRDVRIDFGGSSAAWCVAASPALVPAAGAPIGDSSDCDCATAGSCNPMGDGEVLSVALNAHPGVTAAAATLAENFAFDNRLGLVIPLADPHSATFNSPSGKYALQVQVTPLGQSNLCVPTGKPSMSGVAPC